MIKVNIRNNVRRENDIIIDPSTTIRALLTEHGFGTSGVQYSVDTTMVTNLDATFEELGATTGTHLLSAVAKLDNAR